MPFDLCSTSCFLPVHHDEPSYIPRDLFNIHWGESPEAHWRLLTTLFLIPEIRLTAHFIPVSCWCVCLFFSVFLSSPLSLILSHSLPTYVCFFHMNIDHLLTSDHESMQWQHQYICLFVFVAVCGGADQPELRPADCGQCFSGQPFHLFHLCHHPHQLPVGPHGGNGM